MVLTQEIMADICHDAEQVEFGKVTIEIESQGKASYIDVVTSVRKRYAKGKPVIDEDKERRAEAVMSAAGFPKKP